MLAERPVRWRTVARPARRGVEASLLGPVAAELLVGAAAELGGGRLGAGGGGAGGAEKIVSPTCDGQDCWTYLGRDSHSTFFNSLENKITVANASTLHQFWKTDTGSTATGTAAVVGDTVYFMAQNNTRAFNRTTGDKKWDVPGGGSSSITWDAGKLYVQHPDKRGCFEAGCCHGWHGLDGGGQRPGKFAGRTPFVFGNLVLVGTSSSDEWANQNSSFVGRVRAIDKDTHAEVWHFDTIKGAGSGAPVWSSQSADANLGMIYVTTGNNYYALGGDSDSIVALDVKVGCKIVGFPEPRRRRLQRFSVDFGRRLRFRRQPHRFRRGRQKARRSRLQGRHLLRGRSHQRPRGMAPSNHDRLRARRHPEQRGV